MYFRLRAIPAVALFLACGLTSSSFALAGPAEKFAELHKQYQAVDKQLGELMNLYYETDASVRDTILKEYLKQVDKANTVLTDLRAAGIEAYKEDPNKDEKLTSVLVGLVANDLRRDRYEEAAELAQLLIDNECEKKVVLDLAGRAAYALDDFEKAETLLEEAKTAKALTAEGKKTLEDIPVAKERYAAEQEARQKEAEADDLPRVKLETSEGTIVVELYENEAPQTVGNFISLVEKGSYDGTLFHRVISGFMAQGGDPKGEGTGGPGYKIFCECEAENHRNHFRGTLSMAHSGKDTGGSQFFITFQRASHLDGKHTVFGRVIEGIDVLEKLQRRQARSASTPPAPDKIIKATVVRKRDHVYEPTKVPDKEKPKTGAGEKKKEGESGGAGEKEKEPAKKD
jgi:cyclophilin family peptidyl-prolyl cis-trans isomerase